MEDSVHLRAIFIGASLILILTIFTLVMNYYTKAKEEASKSLNMEIETVYQANIEAAISSAVDDDIPLDASQVKNMINYYYDSYKVLVNLVEVKLLTGEAISVSNANNCSNDLISKVAFSELDYKKINFNIDPNQGFELGITETNGVTIYTLTKE